MNQEMSDITVIGLGAMGTALAKAQLSEGRKTTVWNRTASKADPLIAEGAVLADNVTEAIRSAPVILICIDDYAATQTLLSQVPEDAIAGRILVQFSTGSPKEARDSATWVAARGGAYLDGAIMCYPDEIGGPDALIIIGGAEAAFRTAEPFLVPLCSDLSYLGENVAAPAALAMGLLATSVALYLGIAHAARLCEAEEVSIGALARVDAHGDRSRKRLEIIDRDAFALNSLHGGASLEVYANVVHRLQQQARDAGISGELPDFLARFYDRGVADGHGAEDVAALVKVLRDT